MSFDEAMYEQLREGAQRSAAAVVPFVCGLVKPETVVDVGGGEGWWARHFAALGSACVVLDESATTDDGDDHYWDGGVHFRHFDLGVSEEQGVPIPPAGCYDLALCLEVGEHLPPEYADALVKFLCQLAPVVLWSAAIPGQGGHGHINEQWPAYWQRKFHEYDMACTDFIRWKFWNDERVEPWYRQNMLMFAKVETLCDMLSSVEWHLGLPPAPVVHPDIYGWRLEERDKLKTITDGFTWTGP